MSARVARVQHGAMMNAGRELDALVAEKVMGWEFKPFYNGGGDWICNGKKVAFGGFNGGSLPKYSTDIAAAWQVVERMKERGEHMVMLSARDSKTYQCTFFASPMDNRETAAMADAAPLAICLAALKAVGEEVDK